MQIETILEGQSLINQCDVSSESREQSNENNASIVALKQL